MTQAVLNSDGAGESKTGAVSIVSQEWLPGSYTLKDAWFPIAHSPHVKTRPIRRVIHSQPYYLWRQGNQVLAAESHPARARSGPVSYTEFTGGTGRYPALERYGYVWVWYGNPENASEALVPDVPYLPRSGAKLPSHMWGQIYFDCAYELCAENLMDLVHADYLHSDVVGNEVNEGDRVTVESTSETVTMTREVTAKQIPPALRALGIRARRADYKAVAHVHVRSGVVILHGKFTPGFSQPLFHPLVPESRHLCRANYSFNITDAPFIARNLFPLFAYKIGPQDNFMMRAQNPRYMEPAGRRDVSSRFDAAASRYRVVMSKLARRQQEGDFSYLGDADPAADIAAVLGCQRAR